MTHPARWFAGLACLLGLHRTRDEDYLAVFNLSRYHGVLATQPSPAKQ